MSECYEHEKKRVQGSPCPYCTIERLTAESKADKIRLVDMEATCEFLHETEADNERLTALIVSMQEQRESDGRELVRLQAKLKQANAVVEAAQIILDEADDAAEQPYEAVSPVYVQEILGPPLAALGTEQGESDGP